MVIDYLLLKNFGKFNDKGMTFLVAVENFEDVENIANRMLYINGGELICKCKVRKDSEKYKLIKNKIFCRDLFFIMLKYNQYWRF